MDKDHYCGIFYSNVWVYGHKLNLAPGQVLRRDGESDEAWWQLGGLNGLLGRKGRQP